MRRIPALSLWVLFLATIALFPRPSFEAQVQAPPDASLKFNKLDMMIPVRDGVRLHTEIYTPKDAKVPLPFILERTPYGLSDDDKGYSRIIYGTYSEMVPDGYIFVFQDIRGRFGSEGQFVMTRDPRDKSDPKSIDEASDAYDTIDWLVKNVPNNNGRAGVVGISYGGWLTAMTLLEPHPAMKAVSEQASPADMFLGDDFHHNGAFRLSYGFEYAALLESGKTNFTFQFDTYDTYSWYLNLGPLSNANERYFHGSLPTWNDFVNHPNYDEFWKKQAFRRYFENLKTPVPNLNVAGWWDQEDFYGPMKIYDLMAKNDTDHKNYLVVGPWNHGGWARSDGDHLGPVQFGSATSRYFREKVQAAWFAYWLKDKGALPVQGALTFETGANQWKSYDSWPPKTGVESRKLYFHDSGKLSFEPPSDDAEPFDSYVSDPANPVPYRSRPVEETYSRGSRWFTWLVEDQRFVEHRPDTLTWVTDPLKDDVVITGDIVAHLFASTTGTDSDWIVKFIDVYPDIYEADPKMGGYELMISDEVFRGRFRNSFEKPEPVVANQVTPFTIDLHTNNHAFLKGHRIMVQVQSTWFPIIDCNPQKFVPNIFKAEAADYQKAAQKIYRSRRFPSNVEFPVAER
jgi:putative CocE/NonD family hydrolase